MSDKGSIGVMVSWFSGLAIFLSAAIKLASALLDQVAYMAEL